MAEEITVNNNEGQISEETRKEWAEVAAKLERRIAYIIGGAFGKDGTDEWVRGVRKIIDEAVKREYGADALNLPAEELEKKRKERKWWLEKNLVLYHVSKRSTPFGGSPENLLGEPPLPKLDFSDNFIQNLWSEIKKELEAKHPSVM